MEKKGLSSLNLSQEENITKIVNPLSSLTKFIDILRKLHLIAILRLMKQLYNLTYHPLP